jgi:hypothetical protein
MAVAEVATFTKQLVDPHGDIDGTAPDFEFFKGFIVHSG